MILKNKSEQFSAKGFYEALQIHLVTKDWNITNLWGKEIKQNTLWKKTIPKGKITKYMNINSKILEQVLSLFTYPDHNILIHPQNIENSIWISATKLMAI